MSAFQLPIALLDRKEPLDSALINDLELLDSDGESLFSHVLGPSEGLGARTFKHWSQYYTSDRRFLRDSQRLVSGRLPAPVSSEIEADIVDLWDQLERRDAAGDVDDFHSRFQFIDFRPLKWMNMHPFFLTMLSAYNIGSPLLSLATPIFIMLVPFVILRMRSSSISMTGYLEVLRIAMRNHALGKIFDIGSASLQQKFYIALSLGFYALQVYQNIRSCIQFCSNLTTVRRHVRATKSFLHSWLARAKAFESRLSRLRSYSMFLERQRSVMTAAQMLHDRLPDLYDTDRFLTKAKGIGHTMQAFYLVHQDPTVRYVLGYSLDWCGYVENLREIKNKVSLKQLQKCKLSLSKTRFDNAFFPSAGLDAVRNSYGLDKHILVTGPNAAGKTTLLKATLFNVLLSQQIGHGFYSKAVIAPYDKIHCYINIPDTGGRDSLFQAEARRCRNILKEIESLPKGTRHFCVFDELYSGTNPYEAIGSAEAFLRFIGDNPNVSFVMTTHFLELCARLDSHKRISNRHMGASCDEEGMHYSYKLQRGISNVRGGVEVLRELEYPASVVSQAAKVVSALSL